MYDFGHKTGMSGTNLQYNYAVMKSMVNFKKMFSVDFNVYSAVVGCRVLYIY